MHLFEIFLIGSGTLLLALAAYLGRRRSEAAENPALKQPFTGMSHENAVKLQTSLTQLLNELHALSRDMTINLDQKLSELKQLLQLADTTLEGMPSIEVAEQPPNESTMETRTDEEESVKSPEPELQITVEDEETPPSPSDRYQEIYQMAEEGLPVDEIARRMEMGKGEVQLILSLRNKD